jgi:hypothetical protein
MIIVKKTKIVKVLINVQRIPIAELVEFVPTLDGANSVVHVQIEKTNSTVKKFTIKWVHSNVQRMQIVSEAEFAIKPLTLVKIPKVSLALTT